MSRLLTLCCAAALCLLPVSMDWGSAQAPRGGSEGENHLVAVELATVGLDRRAGAPVVLLRDPESGQVLPIWVGPAEAQAIVLALHGVVLPRPMTHDLMANLLRELRATVEEVVVDGLHGSTYHGSVRLRVDGEDRVREVDSRPSDALALALRTDAPIRVARGMLVAPPDFDFVAPEDGEQVVHAAGVTVVRTRDDLRERFGLPDRDGLVVTHVFGRARLQGLRRGDLIVALNGDAVQAPVDLLNAVRATPSGGVVRLTVWRDAQERHIDLPVDAPPERSGPRIIVRALPRGGSIVSLRG